MTQTPLNPSILKLNAPPIPAVQKSASRYKGAYGPLLDLSQAVPGYPAHKTIREHLGVCAQDPDLLGYGDIEGELCLRQAYATELSVVYDANVAAAEVHITAGCNQAFVAAALTVAGPGDSLLLVTPFYFNHESTLSMLGIRVKTVATLAEDSFLPDPEQIAQALTPDVRAVVCVTPNNPTGAIYPDTLLNSLFEMCVSKGVWLMIDETYRDFLPEDKPRPHELLRHQNWQDGFIGLYSFSKSFCIPGHRLGAITAGSVLVENVAKVMDNLQICAPRAAQVAVAKSMEDTRNWRHENRREIVRRKATLMDVMAQLPDWDLISIGAYFGYVRHPYPKISSIDVAQRLAEERGVVTLPGAFFGDDQESFLRFAFANATSSELEGLAERLL